MAMSKPTREEDAAREKFVLDAWKQLWPKGPESHLAKPVSAKKVNLMLIEAMGGRMRSDKIYRLRDRAIDELRNEGHEVPDPPRKNRAEGPPSYAGAPLFAIDRPAVVKKGMITHAGRNPDDGIDHPLPHIIKGLKNPDEVSKVITELRGIGVTNLTVQFAGDSYIIVDIAR